MITMIRPYLAVQTFSFKRQNKKYIKSSEEMRILLPYIVEATNNPLEYVLKNRDYCTLGSKKDRTTSFKIKLVRPLSAEKRKLLAINKVGNDLYLYDDGTTPWSNKKSAKAYCDKIAILKGLCVDEGENLNALIEQCLIKEIMC